MPGENLENNLQPSSPEANGQKVEGSKVEGSLFDRESIRSDIETAKKERADEILGRLSDTPANSVGEATGQQPDITEEKDNKVAAFVKEALFGKEKIEKIINEVKKANDPYILDSFHDRLMEEMKKHKEKK